MFYTKYLKMYAFFISSEYKQKTAKLAAEGKKETKKVQALELPTLL